ncbi:hypothetical protein GCM10009837_74020 [Streptomyces durmitorensis]|uniref:SPW repeat-containing protein n=1 Tax=Streptomyces durmitorensis TaxID=319947 RepID=A0ABY4PKH4_9ACTN|nr:hypothetical protein [Streptomyces durmitorensis]UQT53870.1 hypothetical protein M4V62_01580 [Streptomyces durmitorensis]
MAKYSVNQRVKRFFRLPRDAARKPPTPYGRLVGIWLAVLAVGAVVTATGWDDEFGGSYLMAVLLVLNAVDDIIGGVRHRWPAALAAVVVLPAASRLTGAVLPGSLDAAWEATLAAAVGVTLGMAVAAAITRLPFPGRRAEAR